MGSNNNQQNAMKIKRKMTNKKQLEKLVEIMRRNPEIAKGIYKKSQIQAYWKKYAEELNSLGPPIRTPENWLKVWADFKFNTKKKLIHNKKEIKATGGGPNNLQIFSPLEEDVVELLNLNVTVNPSGKEFGLQERENENQNTDQAAIASESFDCSALGFESSEQLISDEISNNSQSKDGSPSIGNITTTRNRIRSTRRQREVAKSNSNSERVRLLQELTQSQEGFYKELRNEVNEMKTYMKEISEYKRKAYYLKKETSKELLKIKNKKFEIYEKEMQKKREDRVAKLQLKKEILELKKQTKELLYP